MIIELGLMIMDASQHGANIRKKTDGSEVKNYRTGSNQLLYLFTTRS